MSEEEDYSQFDVNISGKEYRTVAGRLKEFLDAKEKNKWQVFKYPEWLVLSPEPVCRYHICVLDKDGKFLWYSAGTAGAYDKTMIDKSNPYENAETSAMGRTLASEGYGLLSSIASAEEVTEAKKRQTTTSNIQRTVPPSKTINDRQVGLLNIWFGIAGVSEEWKENLKKINKIEHWSDLTKGQMDDIKNALIKSDHLAFRPMVDENGEPVLDGRGKQKELAYNPRTESAAEKVAEEFEGSEVM